MRKRKNEQKPQLANDHPKDQPKKVTQLKPTLMQALEPRLLFDAAAIIEVVAADAEAENQAAEEATAQDAQQNETQTQAQQLYSEQENVQAMVPERRSDEIVFVDTSVDDYQVLVADLDQDINIVYIDSRTDGIEQISDALASYEDLSAIHIVTHGSSGELNLGNGTLNTDSLGDYGAALAVWRNALSNEGDIMLYGCNVAEGAGGQAFIDALSGVLEADIAASTDLTGHSDLGGDWELEAQSVETGGSVNTAYFFGDEGVANYYHVLDPPIFDVTGTVDPNYVLGLNGSLIVSNGLYVYDDIADYDGGQLSINISAGDHVEDTLTLGTTGEGYSVQFDAIGPGSVEVDSGAGFRHIGSLASSAVVTGSTALVINFDIGAGVTTDELNVILQATTFSNANTSATTGTRTITYSINDAEGLGPTTVDYSLDVLAEGTPHITVASSVEFTVDNGAIPAFSTTSSVENTLSDFSNGSLSVSLTGLNSPGFDDLVAFNGENIRVGFAGPDVVEILDLIEVGDWVAIGTSAGNVTEVSGTDILTVDFSGYTPSNLQVEQLLQNITYNSMDSNNLDARSISFTLSDMDGSLTSEVTIDKQTANAPPEMTTDIAAVAFNPNIGGPVAIDSDMLIFDLEEDWSSGEIAVQLPVFDEVTDNVFLQADGNGFGNGIEIDGSGNITINGGPIIGTADPITGSIAGNGDPFTPTFLYVYLNSDTSNADVQLLVQNIMFSNSDPVNMDSSTRIVNIDVRDSQNGIGAAFNVTIDDGTPSVNISETAEYTVDNGAIQFVAFTESLTNTGADFTNGSLAINLTSLNAPGVNDKLGFTSDVRFIEDPGDDLIQIYDYVEANDWVTVGSVAGDTTFVNGEDVLVINFGGYTPSDIQVEQLLNYITYESTDSGNLDQRVVSLTLSDDDGQTTTEVTIDKIQAGGGGGGDPIDYDGTPAEFTTNGDAVVIAPNLVVQNGAIDWSQGTGGLKVVDLYLVDPNDTISILDHALTGSGVRDNGGSLEILVDPGSNQFDEGDNVWLAIGTFNDTSGSYPDKIDVTLNSNATDAYITTFFNALTFDSAVDPAGDDRSFGYELHENGGLVDGEQVYVTVDSGGGGALVQNLGDSAIDFSIGGSPLAIARDMMITDNGQNWDGGILAFTIPVGSDLNDSIEFTGDTTLISYDDFNNELSISLDGGFSFTMVGSMLSGPDTDTMAIQFNANATTELVNVVLNEVYFHSADDAQTISMVAREIDIELLDGDSTVYLDSFANEGINDISISIVVPNNAPVIGSDAASVTFNNVPVAIDSDITISDTEENWDGGLLVVQFSGFDEVTDQLILQADGNGVGNGIEIDIDGNITINGGPIIGVISPTAGYVAGDGDFFPGNNALTITGTVDTFSSDIQLLAQNIFYNNTDPGNMAATTRNIDIIAVDTQDSAGVGFEVTIPDGSPTFTADPALAEFTEGTVNSGTDLPTLLANFNDTDGGSAGIAIISVDNTNGTWELSTDSGSSWVDIATTYNIDDGLGNGGTDALMLDGTLASTVVRFVPNPGAEGTSQTLGAYAWDQSSSPAIITDLGATGATVAAADVTGSAFSDNLYTVSVDITNIQPTLSGPGTLPDVAENESNPSGQSVSDLLNGTMNDPGSLEGIIIAGADSTNGSWQYTLDGGSEWLSLDAASDTNYLALAADDPNALVRYVPDANTTGTADLTYHAWDQSAKTSSFHGMFHGPASEPNFSGLPSLSQLMIDIPNGPFSEFSETATVTITANNAAPSITSGAILAYTEGDTATAVDSLLELSDAGANWENGTLVANISANSELSDTLSVLETGGITLAGLDVVYGGNTIATADAVSVTGSNAMTFTLTASADDTSVQALARAIAFENSDASDSTTRTVTYAASDAESATSSTTALVTMAYAEANSMNITANPSGYEGSAVNLGLSISNNDSDETFTVNINNIPNDTILRDGEGNALTVTNNSYVVTDPALLSSLTIEFDNPQTNGNINLSVDYQFAENGTAFEAVTETPVTVTINAVGEAPTLTLSIDSTNVQEDLTLNLYNVISAATASESDTLALSVSGLPQGTIITDQINPNVIIGVNGVDQSVDITEWDMGTLQLKPPAHFSGTIDMDITAVATDGNSSGESLDTLTISVIADADTPLLTVSDGVTGDANSIISLANTISPSLVDTDGSEVLSILLSDIQVGATLGDGEFTFTSSAGLQSIDISSWNLNSLQFEAPDNFSGTSNITVTAVAEETANSNSAMTSEILSITVNEAIDGPAVFDLFTNEDTPADMTISRGFGNETVTHLQVSAISGGTITHNGNPVSNNAFIAYDGNGDIQLRYTPDANQAGNEATFGFNLQSSTDGSTAVGEASSVGITVTPTPDQPIFTFTGGNTVTTDQEIPVDLPDMSVAVADASESITGISVFNLPFGTILSDTTNNISVSPSYDGETISLIGWDLNALELTPPDGYSGNLNVTFLAQVTESDFSSAVYADTVLVQVDAGEATAPTLVSDTYQLTSVSEGGASSFGDSVSLLTTGMVNHSFPGFGGIAVTDVDNSNGQWQFSTGGPWQNMPDTISSTNALLLRDTDFIRFVSTGDHDEDTATTFDFVAWDRTTSEGPGEYADDITSAAFSADSAIASMTIVDTGDDTGGGNSGDQDDSIDIGSLNYYFNYLGDVSGENVSISFVEGGTLVDDEGTPIAAGDVITIAQLNNLTFTPSDDYYGAKGFEFEIKGYNFYHALNAASTTAGDFDDDFGFFHYPDAFINDFSDDGHNNFYFDSGDGGFFGPHNDPFFTGSYDDGALGGHGDFSFDDNKAYFGNDPSDHFYSSAADHYAPAAADFHNPTAYGGHTPGGLIGNSAPGSFSGPAGVEPPQGFTSDGYSMGPSDAQINDVMNQMQTAGYDTSGMMDGHMPTDMSNMPSPAEMTNFMNDAGIPNTADMMRGYSGGMDYGPAMPGAGGHMGGPTMGGPTMGPMMDYAPQGPAGAVDGGMGNVPSYNFTMPSTQGPAADTSIGDSSLNRATNVDGGGTGLNAVTTDAGGNDVANANLNAAASGEVRTDTVPNTEGPPTVAADDTPLTEGATPPPASTEGTTDTDADAKAKAEAKAKADAEAAGSDPAVTDPTAANDNQLEAKNMQAKNDVAKTAQDIEKDFS